MSAVFCLFYKAIVSCITKCVTETPIKVMMTRELATIDQMYSSVRSMMVKSVMLDTGRSNKNQFLDHNRLVKQAV